MMTQVRGDARLAGTTDRTPPLEFSGGLRMVLANYPFLDVFWTMFIFFLWVSWFMLLFHVVGDVFRRRDASGGKKTLWLIFLLFVPFIGAFAYLIANGDGMAQRNAERV
jgi:phospholipase D-like protein